MILTKTNFSRNKMKKIKTKESVKPLSVPLYAGSFFVSSQPPQNDWISDISRKRVFIKKLLHTAEGTLSS